MQAKSWRFGVTMFLSVGVAGYALWAYGSGAKLQAVEIERTVESGFFAMTDDEYTAALEYARAEVRKANPKMSDSDVEAEAVQRTDEAKRRHETSFTRRASSTYELKRP